MSLIESQKPLKIKTKFQSEPTFDSISTADIHSLLDQQASLVTANQRLARFRLQSHEKLQLKNHKQAWHTPDILSWQSWLRQQWQQAQQGLWLSTAQEALLWRAAVLEDNETHVLHSKSLSKQAMEAWNILADYGIDPACLQHAGEEHQALWRWAHAVQEKLKHINPAVHYVQNHEILTLLSTLSPENPPSTLILDGFDSFSPAQLGYFKHLADAGTRILCVESDADQAQLEVIAYSDEEQEIRQICQHIRHIVAESPEASIGVFVPDLEQRATTISRLCSEELTPALSLTGDNDAQGDYFNISIGSVLGKQPMIQCAFSLLSLSIKPLLQHADTTELLLNPYLIGHAEEAVARAQLDAYLRQNNNHQLALSQLLQACQHADAPIPLFHHHLQQLHDNISNSQLFLGKNQLSHWVMLAESILESFCWHQQADSPHALTQVKNWQEMVQQLTTLDDFCGLLSWSEALGRLTEYAFEQPFRPAPGQANIQIMGLLEAAHLRFEHAFLIGMDEQTWPAAAKPHPLIPVDIQVQHQTPHANSEREWLFAQSVWQHLLHVSPVLHISYAKARDKQEVQASPLLQTIHQSSPLALDSYRYALGLQAQDTVLEDIPTQPIAVTGQEAIRGGTGLLKAQSACAFQAFAQYRLHVRDIETPSKGLNASEQGVLLHAALDAFWKKIITQQALCLCIAQDTLDTEIQCCLQQAWHDIKRPISLHTKRLEEQRLQQLLTQWLHVESQRPPFRVIASEAWRDVKLGSKQQLPLHTKLDRIDSDNQGHHIIIDYKTGKASPSKALGERPDEPQLPIYYLAEQHLGKDVAAIAFAQVRSFDHAFKGFSQESDVLPKIKAFKGRKDEPQDWAELTAQWREALHQLADDFSAGTAEISPKNTSSCNYCAFSGLCRYECG